MTEPNAGWYRDPADDRAWRWWDGAAWTGHVRAVENAAPQPVPVQPVTQAAPVQTAPVQYVPEQTVTQAVPVQTAPEQTAPAQPTPAPAVPQPGEVAAPPAAPGRQVASAFDIPVTDQMYWHSPAAEVIEVPRLPHTTISRGIGGNRQTPGFVRDWQDLGSPNTAGIWLMAAMPLMSIPLGVAMGLVFAIGGVPDLIGYPLSSGIGLGLYWVFAYLDQRALAQRGYHAPSIWWMLLLPPLIYFIKRGRAVRRENMRAWPPELLYVGSILLLMAAGLYLAYAMGVLSGRFPAIG
jgi:hypothetical protein